MEKNESSKLNSKSSASVSGSVLGVASIGEGDARASTPVSGPDPGCWRFSRFWDRVSTARGETGVCTFSEDGRARQTRLSQEKGGGV